MGDLLYLLVAYWPYVALTLAVGVLVGWWTEATRATGEAGWLQGARDEP